MRSSWVRDDGEGEGEQEARVGVEWYGERERDGGREARWRRGW